MLKKHDLSDEARDILDEIEDMSRCNATNGTTREVIVRPGTGETVTVTLPWAAALERMTRRVHHSDALACAKSMLARCHASHAELVGLCAEMVTRLERPASRQWLLPTYDGDRPADMTDEEYARLTYPGRSPRLETRDAIYRWLVVRGDALYDDEKALGGGFGSVIRATHRALHRALVGEDTRGCKWCAEAAR